MAQSLKFIKRATVGTEGLTTGAVYFETSTGLIKVAKSATEVDVFGGNLKDFSFENSKLTLTPAVGSPIVLDFADVASAGDVNKVLGSLRTSVNANATAISGNAADIANLQAAVGIADGDEVITVEGLTSSTVVDALKELLGKVKAAAAGGVLSLTGAEGNLIKVGVNETTGDVVLTLDETALASAIADAKKAGTDAATAAATADAKAVEAKNAADAAQGAAEAAQEDATQALEDAAAAQAQADKGVADAAAAMIEAQKKVNAETGKRLMTDAEGAKLEGIEAGAQVNVIEGVQVNGVDLTVDANKKVNVVIPAAAEYSIVKDETSADFAAVYHLQKDGVNVGASINIPKDLVVKSGSVIGTDIVLVLNDADETKITIPASALIEYVTSGSDAADDVIVAVSDTDHKVTASLSDTIKAQLAQAHTHANKTVLDGITAEKVTAWDAAEQNAKNYADGLAVNYDKAGDAADALVAAKAYANSLAPNYDAAGAASAVQGATTSTVKDVENIAKAAVKDVQVNGATVVADGIASFDAVNSFASKTGAITLAEAVEGNVNLAMSDTNVLSAELTWAFFA